MKGALPWPVDGKVLVPFGKYKDPKYNIPVFKNGIEIKTEAGATASSVHGGRAVYADWFEGYGQLLIINHDKGYHSLYGNLSELFYKAGDIIKKGSNVGKIGENGLSNVPTLYFEIRHKGKPIDPLGWLKQKRKINTKMTGTQKTGTKIKRQIKKKR
jgi:septal ring factor EnvC (AmiA/AmiB activator)